MVAVGINEHRRNIKVIHIRSILRCLLRPLAPWVSTGLRIDIRRAPPLSAPGTEASGSRMRCNVHKLY